MKKTSGRFRARAAAVGALACLMTTMGLVSASVASGAGAGAAVAASPGTLSPSYPVTGNATWFTALGAPYGGCGLPQGELDSPHFVALNVYNTPRDYTMYNRPLTGADASKAGMWDNGHNCGRWVEVTISDYCTGTNDGAVNSTFCKNGSWVSDKYNGAKLNMIVGDSCGDPNGWCRDDPYHLDLAEASLNQFVLDGKQVGDMNPDHWNNRHISWKFIQAPNYTGDIKIGFLQGAQTWWAAMAVSHVPNGLHGVQYYAGGAWKDAKMNGDMGQSYIIEPLTSGGKDFKIRATDVDDKLINGGREYSFSLPASCSNQCSTAYTQVSYTTSGGTTTSPTATPSDSPSVTPSVTPSDTPSVTPSVTPSDTPTVTPTSGRQCTATYKVSQSWQGGFQGEVSVKAGSSAITGWTVNWPLGSGQTITQAWGGQLTSSSGTATVKNAAYNGSLAAGASASFGFIGGGNAPNPLPTVTCTAS